MIWKWEIIFLKRIVVFFHQANLAQYIPVFITQMGMNDLEDLLEFDHGTMVSIMGEIDTDR
jgi:hypothetical protein